MLLEDSAIERLFVYGIAVTYLPGNSISLGWSANQMTHRLIAVPVNFHQWLLLCCPVDLKTYLLDFFQQEFFKNLLR